MEPLLPDLARQGVLDAGSVEWAQSYHRTQGVALDTALLELDLIDEDGLLKALGDRYDMAPALALDVLYIDGEVAARVPEGFGSLFRACPIRIESGELITLVAKPLRRETVRALRELYECPVSQRVVTSHHLTVAWNRIHAVALDERSHALEERLEARRTAPSVARALANIGTAPTNARAVEQVLAFARRFVEFAGFFVFHDGDLRLAASSDGEGRAIDAPGLDCSLGAALRHGGYFMGPLAGNAADQAFYEQLRRPLPRWAFAAPVPNSASATVVFAADNGPRGLAKRSIAELTLLVSRLARVESDWLDWWSLATPEANPDSTVRAAEISGREDITLESAAETTLAETTLADATSEEQLAPEPVAPVVSSEEALVLERLRQAAEIAGLPLVAFVDSLLQARAAPPAVDAAAGFAGEVKDLFEKLATNIPAQLALGMESAFKELVPRLQTGSVAAPAYPAAAAAPTRAPAQVALVKKDAGPREVKSYASRRKKTKRILL